MMKTLEEGQSSAESTRLARCGSCRFTDFEKARQTHHNPGDDFDLTCVFCTKRQWRVSPTKFVCSDYAANIEEAR